MGSQAHLGLTDESQQRLVALIGEENIVRRRGCWFGRVLEDLPRAPEVGTVEEQVLWCLSGCTTEPVCRGDGQAEDSNQIGIKVAMLGSEVSEEG